MPRASSFDHRRCRRTSPLIFGEPSPAWVCCPSAITDAAISMRVRRVHSYDFNELKVLIKDHVRDLSECSYGLSRDGCMQKFQLSLTEKS